MSQISDNTIGGFPIAGEMFTTQAPLSRLEVVRDDLLAEFAKIIKFNGYKSEVKNVISAMRHPDNIPMFPEIGIVIGNRKIEPMDAAATVFSETADVLIQAVVQADTEDQDHPFELEEATENIAQDMNRVMASIYKSYIVTNDHKWNVRMEGWNLVKFTNLGMKENKSVVIIQAKIHVRNLESKFL